MEMYKSDGLYVSRILARESSATGESSRIFYRANEGVPFQWEMCPGTPKHPQQEEHIPPLSPTPLMQSFGLPLPNIEHDSDDDEDNEKVSKLSKLSKYVPLKKMVKKGMMKGEIMLKKVEKFSKSRGGSRKKQGSSRFGDSDDGEFVVNSVRDSSFSSNSSLSGSFSPNDGRRGRVTDSSRKIHVDGPLCCSPWNFSAILDEGNTRIYYCRHHKTAFTLEEDGLFLSKVLSTISAPENFSGPFSYDVTAGGVPFNWEMQPGTPKNLPENELIPPPSPPPAVQSSGLPLPRLNISDGAEDKDSTFKKVRFWIKKKNEIKESEKKRSINLSFRQGKKKENCLSEKGFDVSFRKSVDKCSSLSSISRSSNAKGSWGISKIKSSLKGSYFSWGTRASKNVLVLARAKLKSLTL